MNSYFVLNFNALLLFFSKPNNEVSSIRDYIKKRKKKFSYITRLKKKPMNMKKAKISFHYSVKQQVYI